MSREKLRRAREYIKREFAPMDTQTASEAAKPEKREAPLISERMARLNSRAKAINGELKPTRENSAPPLNVDAAGTGGLGVDAPGADAAYADATRFKRAARNRPMSAKSGSVGGRAGAADFPAISAGAQARGSAQKADVDGGKLARGMTRGRRGRCRAALVSVHPALIGLAIFALLLGQGRLLALTTALLALHEAAHICAAKALKVPISGLRLTPLGAALELDYRLISPKSEALIAAAGPLCSLASVLALCLLIGRGLDDALLTDAAGIALALTLFNLLPASPLDGGRLLHALLRIRLGERRAGDVCGILGMLLALALTVCVLVSALNGTIPLMLLASAICVFALASGEYLCDTQTAWQLAWAHRDELESGACLPVRVIAIGADTPARNLLGGLRRGATTIFRVTDANMRCLGELGEAELISRCVDSPDATAGQLLLRAAE